MKKIIYTLSLVGLVLTNTLNAQTENQSKQTEKVEVTGSEAKASYIKNRDYLSKNSLSYSDTYHADSLSGFDEAWVKAELLNRGVYGSEYINYLPKVKREYIDRKYKIGPYSENVVITNSPASSGSTTGGKPLGSSSMINIAPCVNEDFEASPVTPLPLANPGPYNTNPTGIQGWTISTAFNNSQTYPPNTTYGAACNANAINTWQTGSPEVWVRQTPIFGVPSIGTLPHSPLGGTRVLQIQDVNPNGRMTRLRSTFPVTAANTLFQFAYAGSWDGVHECCGQPAFRIDMYQEPCAGGTATLMTCSNVSLTPSGANCISGVPGYSVTNGVSWTNWVVRFIDLTPYIGQCVTIQVTNADCSYSGHHGSAYFDARCGGQLIGSGLGGVGGNIPGPVSFCAGSNQAVISAPLGYSTYSWIPPITSPPIPASQATLSTLTITNPIPGAVYTVNLTGSSGCQFISTNTLVFSQVQIIGIGSTTTCIGGASGAATVQGNGSGTGYNYTWINAGTNATVGAGATPGATASIAGLAPGVYSVVLTGLGAQGCGSAVATTTIIQGPQVIIDYLKPYCGSEAYLTVFGGSGYQWYTPNLAPISATAGGTASSYTVTNPGNQQVYWLSYLSQFNCQDSVKFTLLASSPGILGPPVVSWICPGGNNGTAVISMTPAAGSPPGVNSFSVFNNVMLPPYASTIYPTASNTYTASNLSAGSYTVRAFDGSCKYQTTFNVVPFVYSFNVSPVTSTLCPGNSVAANVTFPTPPSQSQYSYSWTPNVYLAGNANTYSSTIITPNIPIGTQTTIVYTVVVTPSVVNCPTTKTLAITAVHPGIPTITAVPNLCNNSTPYQIMVNPTGGNFLTGISGTASPINPVSGLLSPTLATIGVSTFTYNYSIFQCSASNSASYEVSQFQTADLTTPTVAPLCVTSAPFNLMNIVQSSAGGTWTAVGAGAAGISSAGPGLFSFNPAPSSVPGGLNTGNYMVTYTTSSTPNPTVCPDFTNIFISVTKTITPTIASMPEFCTNASLRTMTVLPAGGGWYNNPAVSNLGVVTPTLAGVPNSLAFYSVAIGPCINYATTTLTASQFNPAGFSGTITPQCVSNAPFNLMSIAQSTLGSWSFGGSPNMAQAVTNNSFIPSFFSPMTGLTASVFPLNYNVASTPNNICPDSRSINVSIFVPTPPKVGNIGPLCSTAAPVQLTVVPSVGFWSTSAFLSGNGVFTPSLATVGNNAVQFVVGTSTCSAQQTKFISVEAFVSAKITSQIPDQCNTSPIVNLTPYTMGIGSWIGAGITGNSFNPFLTGSGTFTLTHKTASSPSGLCPDEDQMAVNVYSLATPVLAKMGPFCSNAVPVQIQVSPVGGMFGGPNQGVVNLEGKFNPGLALIGENLINYSVTAGPCVAYAQATISVEQFVSAAFEKSVSPICYKPGKTESINMFSYVQNNGGTFDGDGGVSPANSMFNPSMAKLGKNNRVTYYTHSMPTATLCPDKSEIIIEVRKVPEIKAIRTGGGCVPAEVVFNSPTEPGQGIGTWNFDDGTEPVNGMQVTHVYTTTGTYNATFSFKDDIGCEADPFTLSPIKVNSVPKADFSVPEDIYISNPEVQFTNMTTVLGDNTYEWTFSSLPPSNKVNPVVSFPKIGRYQVSLLATTPLAAGGCTDQVTKTIEVKNDFNIYIPTSFSPNFDGLNDVFTPVFSEYGLDTKSYEMEIFDRWGHSLFRTKDTSKGWDGSVQNKGEPLKEEVYIYRIKYKDLEGNSYSKMGHLTLLK